MYRLSTIALAVTTLSLSGCGGSQNETQPIAAAVPTHTGSGLPTHTVKEAAKKAREAANHAILLAEVMDSVDDSTESRMQDGLDGLVAEAKQAEKDTAHADAATVAAVADAADFVRAVKAKLDAIIAYNAAEDAAYEAAKAAYEAAEVAKAEYEAAEAAKAAYTAANAAEDAANAAYAAAEAAESVVAATQTVAKTVAKIAVDKVEAATRAEGAAKRAAYAATKAVAAARAEAAARAAELAAELEAAEQNETEGERLQSIGFLHIHLAEKSDAAVKRAADLATTVEKIAAKDPRDLAAAARAAAAKKEADACTYAAADAYLATEKPLRALIGLANQELNEAESAAEATADPEAAYEVVGCVIKVVFFKGFAEKIAEYAAKIAADKTTTDPEAEARRNAAEVAKNAKISAEYELDVVKKAMIIIENAAYAAKKSGEAAVNAVVEIAEKVAKDTGSSAEQAKEHRIAADVVAEIADVAAAAAERVKNIAEDPTL